MDRTTSARIAANLMLVNLGMGVTRYLGVRQGQRSASTQAAASVQVADAPLKAGDIDPKTDKRVLYQQDPMALGQRLDKSGKSLFMDMLLTPVYENSTGGSAVATVDDCVTQNLAVRATEVKTGRLGAILEVSGSVTTNERGIEIIQARIAGFVEWACAKTTLDPVECGQPLVIVYVPEWIAAQEEYLAVPCTANALQGDLCSAALLRMRQTGMAEAWIRLVESTDKPRPRLAISSSIGGVITEVGVRDGMAVAPDMTLFKIVDLSTVRVLAEIPESQVSAIYLDQAATTTATIIAGHALTGKADVTLPDVNANIRTVEVRAKLQNRDRHLLPGMFVSVRFGTQTGPDKLLVPTEALTRTDTRTIAMVGVGNGGLNPVEVKTGAEANGQTEATDGLSTGQKVVVFGQFLISSEAGLHGTAQRMASPPAASTPAAATIEHEGVGHAEATTGKGLTISHGAIPSAYWNAMAMDFAVLLSGLPRRFKSRDRARFWFQPYDNGVAVLSSVEPAGANQRGKP